jgi:hypothetical protein
MAYVLVLIVNVFLLDKLKPIEGRGWLDRPDSEAAEHPLKLTKLVVLRRADKRLDGLGGLLQIPVWGRPRLGRFPLKPLAGRVGSRVDPPGLCQTHATTAPWLPVHCDSSTRLQAASCKPAFPPSFDTGPNGYIIGSCHPSSLSNSCPSTTVGPLHRAALTIASWTRHLRMAASHRRSHPLRPLRRLRQRPPPLRLAIRSTRWPWAAV